MMNERKVKDVIEQKCKEENNTTKQKKNGINKNEKKKYNEN